VNEFASNVERHRRELLLHCYRMLGSLPDAEDAVQETLLRAWRYRDSLKEGAPLRPWLYRVATNACLDAIARDERRAVLAARATAGSRKMSSGWGRFRTQYSNQPPRQRGHRRR
jgi:RNA polymerase sigma-70 factor, ECF subfamily